MKKSIIAMGLFAATNVMAADEVKPFTMDGEFGFIATSGNTETTSVKGKLAAHQELERWSNDFVFEVLYKEDEVTLESGEDESQTTAQKFFLSGQSLKQIIKLYTHFSSLLLHQCHLQRC